MAAVAALAGLVLVLATQGDANADASAGPLLLAPGLALFVAAYVTARVLAPLTRTLQRLLAHSAFPLRLASLSIARAPGQAVVAAAFLVVSVGLAVFALLYVTTLRNGIDDQAAYGVPADFVVSRVQGGTATPLGVAGLDRYRALAPGTAVTPVLREQGSASTLGGTNELTLLGVPAADLPRLDGWRSDFSPTPVGDARATASRRPCRRSSRRSRCRRGAKELTLPVRTSGDDVGSSARSSAATAASSRPTSDARAARSRSSCTRRSRPGSRARGCSGCASSACPRSSRTPTAAGRSCAASPCSARCRRAATRSSRATTAGRASAVRARRRRSARTRSTTSSARRPTRSGG